MSKSILILNNEEDWNLEVPDFTPSQNLGYSTWGEVCANLNIKLFRSNIHWFKDGQFTKGWEIQDGAWKKVDGAINPSVIYDKCGNFDKSTGNLLLDIQQMKINIEKAIPILNNTYFDSLIDNKLNQAVIFKDFLPFTRLALAGEVIKNEQGDTIVIKNIRGSGGKQVQIKNDKNITVENNSIIQDFIDAKENDSVSDIRIVFLGDTPQYALTRIAEKGSLFTNFHRGASIEFLDLDDLQELLNICREILRKLEAFDRKIFSLDFMHDNTTNKYLLVEANTKPGLDVFDEKSIEILKRYLTNLSNYLVN